MSGERHIIYSKYRQFVQENEELLTALPLGSFNHGKVIVERF